jgi:TolA-binding protein
MEKRNVTIHRSTIDNLLMKGHDLMKMRKRSVIFSAVVIVMLAVLTVGGFAYYDIRSTKELEEWDKIIMTLEKSDHGDAAIDKAIRDLTAIVDKSLWGYPHKHGNYVIAGMLFERKRFEEAQKFFLKSADGPSSDFTPLALFQAGICAESLNRYDQALEIYKRLDKDFGGSTFKDKILYDLGRMYQKKGEIVQAREQFSQVITRFPNSILVPQAKARLFLIGIEK